MSNDVAVPARALAVGAHADDVEFGCGGTLAKWAAAGCAATVVVCTDGSKGTWDAAADVGELVRVRAGEAGDAARALGSTTDVIFLGAVDGELQNDEPTRRRLVDVIRRVRPDAVLGHDPWQRYRLHPDHRAAGFLVTDAIVAARDPHFLPDVGGAPHRPDVLLLFEADEPNHVEDVTDHVEAKLDALLAHRSQYRSTMKIDDAGDAAQVQRFRRRVHDRAAEHGRVAGVRAGEAFRVVSPL